MKRIGWAVVALVVALAVTASAAPTRLTVVLDNCKEMRSAGAVETAISYINTLMQGYAKNPNPPELEVTLYQICAETPFMADTRPYYIDKTCSVGDGQQFFPEKKSSAERESPIVLPATKEKTRNLIFDWADKNKSDGIILVSPDPVAKALNLGEGFHTVIIPARDAKNRLAKNQFTADLQVAIDEFLEVTGKPGASVAGLKASSARVYTLGAVAFEVELEGCETATVDFGDGTSEEYCEGTALRHAYQKAGRYTVTAKASAKDAGKSVAVAVLDAAVADLAVRPQQLTTAEDAVVSFVLRGAPSAEIRFGDGTDPVFAKPTSGLVSVRHRYGKPGSYTLQAIPRNGARAFAAAALAVVVGDEPRRLGLDLKAVRAKATLPNGRIEFFATLDNAVRAEIDFGDGSVPEKATTARMAHDYNQAGAYEVKLTAWAADGSTDSRTCAVQIAEPAVPVPTCEFTPGEGSATAGGAFEVRCQFSNTESATASFSDAPDAALSLDIGEDGASTIRHEFRSDGEQFVLVTMEGNGKTSEARYRVAVERPDESFGNLLVSVVRNGAEESLGDNGTGYYQIKVGEELICGIKPSRNVSIRVDFGDGNEERGTTSVSHTYQQSGEYTVTLRGTGSITKTPKGPITFTVQVKGDSLPILILLGVLVILVGGFFGLTALLKPKYFLRVTPPRKEPLNRNFGLIGHRCDLSLDGLNVVVALKGETLELTSPADGVTANGQPLGAEVPVEIAESKVEVVFGNETWTIECLKK